MSEGEGKIMMEKSTETVDPGSWELMNSRPTAGSLHGSKLSPLHVGNSCLAGSV